MASRDRLIKLRRLKELRDRVNLQTPVQPDFDPTENINVAEELSGTERFFAGAGKGIVDVGRGIEQVARGLVPGVSPEEEALQQEIDESRRLDQPLLETGAGLAGNITGGIAASVPTLAIPGGASLLGGAAIGAGIGGLSPVATDESRLSKIGAGIAGGALGSAAGKALSGAPSLVSALKKAVGKVAPAKAPEKLFEQVAKFRTTIPAKKRSELVNTALDEGISPTREGLTKLDDTINELNNQIDAILTSATNEGIAIPKGQIFKELKQVRKEIGGVKFNAAKDIKRLNRIVGAFDEQLKRLGKDTITPLELQSFKKDLYQRINFDAKQGSTTFLNEKVEKAVARGARNALGKLDPKINAINQREGALIALRSELPKTVSRIENRDIIGLGGAAKIGAGAVLGGELGAVAGAGAAFLGAPLRKANLAIALRQSQLAPIARSTVLPAAARLGGIESGQQLIDSLRNRRR